MKNAFVYILASSKRGTLYVGVTSNLVKRVTEHKTDITEGFYSVHLLVYYEVHGEIREAIIGEKQIKEWNRAWKIELIEKENPKWVDLYSRII